MYIKNYLKSVLLILCLGSSIHHSFSQDNQSNIVFLCDSTQSRLCLSKVDETYFFHDQQYPIIHIVDPEKIAYVNIISKDSPELEKDSVFNKYKDRLNRIAIIKTKNDDTSN